MSLIFNEHNNMQRIFLVGYMGAGKTTIGKALAKQMNLSFIDLDHFIESRFHKTVRQIFEEKGEEVFRIIEKNALREVAEFEDTIISTGGGTPCFHANMELMNTLGTTVYLKASADELTKRIALNKNTRPILKDLSGDSLKQFIANALNDRGIYYKQANIIFDTEVMLSEKDVVNLCQNLKEKLLSNK